jgi:phosphoribosylformylglycinamidine cyclo-ligase
MTQATQSSAYARAGVDIDAATDAVGRMKAHIKTTMTPGVLTGVGSFGGMFALSSVQGMSDPVLVSSIDGVGTKLKIAFATGIHNTIGRDLVWHCVNDILVQGARPLFFLDYFGTGKLDPGVAEMVVAGLSEGCRDVGCALIGGETAEMPGLYGSGEYDLAGCIVGIVDRNKIVDGSKVQAGNVLLGLASQGLHTNGYSLARQALLEDGGLSLDAVIPELGTTLGEALLWPHRCYAKPVLSLLDTIDVKAMAHITGGGFIDNIPRVLPEGIGVRIDTKAWDVPYLFQLIQSKGRIDSTEMYRVFNMGIGFILAVSEQDAAAATQALQAAGETVYRLGVTEPGKGVTLS